MNGSRSILNHLARQFGSEAEIARLDAIRHLQPAAQVVSPPEYSQKALHRDLTGYLTAQAWHANPRWVWPLWMEAQTNPENVAFLNPNSDALMINRRVNSWLPLPGTDPETFAGTVDPHGLVTPAHELFSLDVWVLAGDAICAPSRAKRGDIVQETIAEQRLIRTRWNTPDFELSTTVQCVVRGDHKVVQVSARLEMKGEGPGELLMCLRPYTTDGVTSVDDLVYNSTGFWASHGKLICWFARRPAEAWASDFLHGDAGLQARANPDRTSTRCKAGLATAASLFEPLLHDDRVVEAEAWLPLDPAHAGRMYQDFRSEGAGTVKKAGAARASETEATVPVATAYLHLGSLSDPALRSPELVYQRAIAFADTVHAHCRMGNLEMARRLISMAAVSQWKNGFIELAAGMLASNGQFLTAVGYLAECGDETAFLTDIYGTVRKAALWIEKKRHEVTQTMRKPRGLLPASARRDASGLADYHFADNLWSVEGLFAAARVAMLLGQDRHADALMTSGEDYLKSLNSVINHELEHSSEQMLAAAVRRRPDWRSVQNLVLFRLPTVWQRLKGQEWPRRLAVSDSDRLWMQFSADALGQAYALLKLKSPDLPPALERLRAQMNPGGGWPDAIDPGTGYGAGAVGCDIGALALFVLICCEDATASDGCTGSD